MEIAILITHYKRTDALENLLSEIDFQLSGSDIKANIIIHDDHSGLDDSFFHNLEMIISPKCKVQTIIADHNHGKRNYWQVINRIYNILKDINFDYAYQLPEDVRLTDDFFMRSIKIMKDSKAICLNLLSDHRKKTAQWTAFKPSQISDGLWLSGWVDMCYCATPKFFEILNYTINPVPDSWFSKPDISSGVGMQISTRIIKSGHHFHQVEKSLVKHGDYDSVMHKDIRKLEPLKEINVNHNDRYIVASLASIPSRHDSLRQVIDSVINQVNELYVFLNEYTNTPDFLKHKRIHVYRSQSYADLGDIGKFFPTIFLNKNTYHLTMDDDIIYPHDYAKTMCDYIDLYDRKAIVSMHGRHFKSFPVSSYYHADIIPFQCNKKHTRCQYLHIPGTGAMAYHTSTINFTINDFKHINMADIYVAMKAQKHKIPVIGIPHDPLKLLVPDNIESIYHQCHRNDSIQTKEINSVPFKTNKL